MRIKINLLLALLLALCSSGYAQVTSSTLTGIVKDENNSSLVGAIVRAIHQPSGTVYGTATQTDGSFNIQNMRVGGPYRVEVTYVGYEVAAYDSVYLTLGEPYRLNVKMAPSGKELQAVTISANRNSILNNQAMGTATNVNIRELNTLPTISRSITDFTRLSPESGPSFSSNVNNANTFAGRDGRYNNVQINGANFNNAFGLSSDLLPGGGAQPISLDAIEAIQIGIAPYDVRQSNFTGANINAITRSGTNEFTGSVYYFWRNQNFTGTHVGDYDIPDQGPTTKQIYGARIGGPIIKNKLFFFVNAEKEKTTAPGVNWVASKPGVSGSNVSAVPASTLDSISQYVQSKYGYNPGAYQGFANNAVTQNTKVLARLDYNISEKHKLFISFSSLNGTEPLINVNGTSTGAGSRLTNNREGANSLAFANSFYGFTHKVMSVSGQLSSNFNSRLSNELIATYSKIQDTRSTSGGNFPFVDIDLSSSSTVSLGTELFSYKNDLINKNLNIIDNLTYTVGKHTIVGGVSYEYLTFGNSFLPSGTSYYHYASVSDFLNDASPIAFGYTYPFADQGGNSYVKANYGLGAIYLQDGINVTDKFTLTGGVRVEMPFYTYKLVDNPRIDTLHVLDKDGNPVTYKSDAWPKAKPVVSPRIGFNWDVKGDRSLQVRGGTGIFAGNVPFVWFTNQPGGIGTLTNNKSAALSNKSHADSVFLHNMHFNTDPNSLLTDANTFPSKAGTSIPSSIAIVSPDFRMPRVWRTNIAVDKKLPWGLVGTLEAIYSKDLVNVYMRNANLPQPTATLDNGDDNRPYYSKTKYNTATSGFYVLENSNQGQAYIFSAGIAKPVTKGFYGSVYYTGTYSKELSSNPGSQAASAWNGLPNTGSPNDEVLSYSEYLTPHRVVASASYRFEYAKHFATTVSLYYEGASLGRYSYVYGSDINGDGVNADLIYIPKDASELQWADLTIKNNGQATTYTKQQQIDAFNAFINQDKYLSKHKGGYAERYGAKYPFYSRFDFKLIQDLFTSVKGRKPALQFTIDMFNIGNFLNPNWGVQQRLMVGSGNSSPILKVYSAGNDSKAPVYQLATGTDNKGNTVIPASTFTKNISTLSTWSMQLGLRLTF